MIEDQVEAARERLRAAVARCSPRVLVVIGMTVLLVLATILWTVMSGTGTASPVESAPPLFDSTPTTATTAPAVTVHVAGAVRAPGLYRLGSGSRVADAIAAAGGVAEDVDIERVNLAAPIADGQRVFITRRGQPQPELPGGPAPDPSSAGSAGPLDLNTATEVQLEALPGVGPSTAAAIIEQRRRVGRFRSVEDLLEVRGIGSARLDQLRGLVTVG